MEKSLLVIFPLDFEDILNHNSKMSMEITKHMRNQLFTDYCSSASDTILHWLSQYVF